MKRERALFSILLITGLFLFNSCATRFTNIWKDEQYQRGPVKKVFVIGVAKSESVKRFFEDEFIRQLKARGTDAVASYSVFPTEAVVDKEMLANKVKELGADAVIATRLVDRRKEQTYVPGNAYAVPGPYRGWGSYYEYATTPGYVVENEVAVLETNLFDVQTESLIWSAQSETTFTAADQKLIQSFIKVIANKLSKDGMIR